MSLHRLPRSLPALSLLLDDLGRPSAAELARALGVGERTVYRWLAADAAPRPAHLALYFASSYGWSLVDSEARHAVQTWRGLAESRGRDLVALEARLRRLSALGDFGSANDPIQHRDGHPQIAAARRDPRPPVHVGRVDQHAVDVEPQRRMVQAEVAVR